MIYAAYLNVIFFLIHSKIYLYREPNYYPSVLCPNIDHYYEYVYLSLLEALSDIHDVSS